VPELSGGLENQTMNDEIEVTGERFIPEAMGGELIDAEHQVRYRFAAPHVGGRRVLDAGCGVGWGSALLLEAGATEVVGLDLDPDAVTDARARVPDASFVVGNLLDLPFDDDSFDLVVCFEAIEHTGDTARTLDQLARVLKTSGLLFVSSPNPAVYPAGNPFHMNEETPEVLLREVGARFRYARLLRHYGLIASVLLEDGDDGSHEFLARVRSVAPLGPGHDPYSLVVGSDAEIPDTMSVAMLAPSGQLDNIATATTALQAEVDRLKAEIEQYERQHREFVRTIQTISDRERAAVQSREQLMDAFRAKVADAEARRDAYAAMVLAAEQDLAMERAQIRDLQPCRDAYELVITSNSWRLTKPLREIGKLLRGRS
jgi:SAM-dependent methyltransferase